MPTPSDKGASSGSASVIAFPAAAIKRRTVDALFGRAPGPAPRATNDGERDTANANAVGTVPTRTADEPREALPIEAPCDVLTVEEVATLLKIGRNAVYEAVGRNELPHRRIGKQIRFSRHAIMRWFDSWSLRGAKEGK
jgi:excisionase family DNA binding protein